MQGTAVRQWTTEFSRGTSGYRAPEMLTGTRLVFNNKVDIWAFGCILHEAATGRKLFETDFAVAQRAQTTRQATHRPSQLPGLSTHASEALVNDNICHRDGASTETTGNRAPVLAGENARISGTSLRSTPVKEEEMYSLFSKDIRGNSYSKDFSQTIP